jgi:uncharacterized cupredoxin-like copper-binding protein
MKSIGELLLQPQTAKGMFGYGKMSSKPKKKKKKKGEFVIKV